MKIYKSILYCAIVGLLFSSCSDWLDVQPETESKEEDLFTEYRGFKSALTGCYMAMANDDAYGKRLTMTNIESLACVWYFESEPYSSDAEAANYYLNAHDYNDVARDAVQTIYSKMYNIIVQLNKIIRNAENNPGAFPNEKTQAVILGEAYALRAYCHLDILRLFGEVPNGTGEKVNLPYSEVAAFDERPEYCDFATYSEKLIADLTKAEELLKDNDPIFEYTFTDLNQPAYLELEDTYMGYRQSRMNYWAVKALQARAFLYLGRTTDAYQAAMAVINGKDVNGEPVMTISGSSDRAEGYKACPNECLFYLSKPDVKTVAEVLIGGASSEYSASYLCTLPERIDDMFPENRADDNRYGTLMWNKQVQSNSGFYAATLKYYFLDDAENKTLYYQIVPMLRMSEVYLIAIETTSDLAEANRLYAEYMLQGCSVGLLEDAFDATSDRAELLIPEYRREFIAEGQLFYTYKRNQATRILWSEEEMADEDYILWNCVNTEFNP